MSIEEKLIQYVMEHKEKHKHEPKIKYCEVCDEDYCEICDEGHSSHGVDEMNSD